MIQQPTGRSRANAAIAIAALAVGIFLLFFAPQAHCLVAVRPAQHRRGRKPRQPKWWEKRVFVPSHENLLAQNAAIDEMGLPRIHDDRMLKSMVVEAVLVPITSSDGVRVSPKLEAKRRYVRPFVNAFLDELGGEYYARFGEPIQVNSAVRTERTQFLLRRWNRNAAPVHGETASAHLAGVAVDLQRRGLTLEQVRFIQRKLKYLSDLGMVIVEEELKQPCFHVVVTGEYPVPPPVNLVISDQDMMKGLDGILNPSPSN
jgi:hypothetical protein